MENRSLQRLTGIISVFLMLFLVVYETCCPDVSLQYHNTPAMQGRAMEETIHPFKDDNSLPFEHGKPSCLARADETRFNRINIELTRILINTRLIHKYIVMRI